jgi:hypothetical protein
MPRASSRPCTRSRAGRRRCGPASPRAQRCAPPRTRRAAAAHVPASPRAVLEQGTLGQPPEGQPARGLVHGEGHLPGEGVRAGGAGVRARRRSDMAGARCAASLCAAGASSRSSRTPPCARPSVCSSSRTARRSLPSCRATVA